MKQWLVAHTQLGKESIAQQHLLQQDFEPYLPRFQKTRRHARRVETVQVPLFPRYLFIHVDLEIQRWRSILGTRGISYLLMHDNTPAIVKDRVIGTLQQQEDEKGLVPAETLKLFSPGQKVHIKEGAFAGQTAIYEKMTDQQRVQVLLSFLGRASHITIPIYTVEAA